MNYPVEVQVTDQRLSLDTASVSRCLELLAGCSDYHVPEGTLGINFVDKTECSRLHREFFSDPSVTDVMTFPGDPEDQHAGDIAICPAVAVEAAMEHGLAFEEELTLYLVHAWLHLAGLDDQEPDAIRHMREAEASLMEKIKMAAAGLTGEWIPDA